jgi:hypothetical protein
MAHGMERVMGIEPTLPAWKAGVLPLNYTRIGAGGGTRTHKITILSRARMPIPSLRHMEPATGIEPATY